MTFKEYLNLLSTLKSLKAAKDKEESEEAMVPIGKFALFRGKVQKPTRLFFDAESNGQLKEIEITQAIAIVEGKLEEMKRNILSMGKEDAVEVNEDGDAFVEISAESTQVDEFAFHDSLKTVEKSITNFTVQQPHNTPQEKQQNIDEADLELLRRIKEMEIEEEADRSKHNDGGMTEYSSDEEDTMGTPSYYPQRQRGDAPQKQENKIPLPRVTSLESSTDTTVTAAKQSTKSKNGISSFVKENKIDSSDEDSYDDDEDDGDAMELEMMGKEISMAYFKKRDQLIASKNLKSDEKDEDEENV